MKMPFDHILSRKIGLLRYYSDLLHRRWTTIAFVIAFLVASGVGLRVIRNVKILTVANQWVEHTHQALAEIEALRDAVVTAESSQRGYLITGKAADLQRYTAADRRSTRESIPFVR